MAFDKSKTDKELGLLIQNHLTKLGLHTPTISNGIMSNESKVGIITEYMSNILQTIGLDLSDDSLRDTPKRLAKMWVDELFWGLNPENFPKITAIDNKMKYDEMLLEKNVKVMSSCEHHIVTIAGVANVAYIPDKKVLGLSKIPRIVEYFCKRPQVQERLTAQIGETLKFITETEDVAVMINAKHYCVISRGVEDQSAETTTSFLSGVFRNNEVRQEFLSLVKL